MKTNIKLIALVILVGFLSSCDDAMHIDQKGEITDDIVFENVNDLQLGLNGVYSQYGTFAGIRLNAVFTDNVKNGKDSNGQNKQLYNHVMNSNSSIPASIWTGRYAAINFANRVLDAYNTLDIDQDNQEEADIIAGQLYGIRALSHFDLYKYFAKSYTDDDALAVPYMDFVPEDLFYEPARNTVGELYAGIISDLDKGQSLMGNADLGAKYLSSDALEVVRARMELFHGNYTAAANAADHVLQNHPLATVTQYQDVFTDQTDNGVIWKKAYVDRSSEVAGLFYFNSVEFDGDPFVEMSNGLYNILNPSDVRYPVLLNPESVFVGTDDPDNVLLINKYPGSGRGPLTNDVKIMRSAEMLLIKAEAAVRRSQNPDIGEAQNQIQQLINNRYDPSDTPTITFNNKTEALKEILKQRRLELAYEGFRFFDIKRFRDALNIGISRDPIDCASYDADNCDLPKDSYKFTLPIPQVELNANSIIQQNTGY